MRSVKARPSGTIDDTIPPGRPVVANVRETSTSVFSGKLRVFGLYTPDRSRTTAYRPSFACCSVPTTSSQSRSTKSVASTSSRPPSSATSGSAATVLGGKLSVTVRACAGLFAALER